MRRHTSRAGSWLSPLVTLALMSHSTPRTLETTNISRILPFRDARLIHEKAHSRISLGLRPASPADIAGVARDLPCGDRAASQPCCRCEAAPFPLNQKMRRTYQRNSFGGGLESIMADAVAAVDDGSGGARPVSFASSPVPHYGRQSSECRRKPSQNSKTGLGNLATVSHTFAVRVS